MVQKKILSKKTISNNIDKNWKFNSDTNTFSHPLYPNKNFKAICENKTNETINEYQDKFGKKHLKKISEQISTLYPYIQPQDDNRNLGYNIILKSSASDFDIISNKMNSFWDTRRGKRYIRYITYRKTRDSNKKNWLEMNPPEKKVKNQSKKK